MSDTHREPSPTNAMVGQKRLVHVRRELDLTTNTGYTDADRDDVERRRRTLTTLRRRYARRGASNFEPDLEEGNRSDLPPNKIENQATIGHDATHHNDLLSSAEVKTVLSPNHCPIETSLNKVAEESIARHDLPLPITNSPNFLRKSDDKLREKFKSLIRNPANGLSKARILDKTQQHNDHTASATIETSRSDFLLPIVHHSNYIRKPDDKLREKFKNLMRSPADGIPEVHIIGELSEGIGFKDTYISCKW